ncbi:MAG TPA: YdaS family helix-turn-helix protein [Bradyrhizobium sp.]
MAKSSRFDIIKLIRKRGLGSPIAKACGIKRQAVCQWRQVPSKRVLIVSKITNIPPHRIRPDLYPSSYHPE